MAETPNTVCNSPIGIPSRIEYLRTLPLIDV